MDSKLSLNLVKHWQDLCQEIVFTDVAALLIQNRVISIDEYQVIVCQPEPGRIQSLLLLLLKKDDQVLLKFVQSLERDYCWLAEKLMDGHVKEESKDETDASPITRLDSIGEIENDSVIKEEKKSSRDICEDCHSLNSVNKNHKLNNSFSSKNGVSKRRKVMKSRVKNKINVKVPNSESVISSTTGLIKPVLNEEVTDEVISIVRRCHLASKSWTTIAHSLGLTEQINDIRFKVVLHGEDLSMCVVYLIKHWLEMCPKTATLSKLIEVLRGENFNSVADKLSERLYRKQINVTDNVH